MSEIAQYLQQLKVQHGMTSDYVLAKRLGITQPEVHMIRRGRRIPNADLCVKLARLLGRHPVELLLIAQRDKAPARTKNYWSLAITAATALRHVPRRPRYLPRKLHALGRELRQLKDQALCLRGTFAQAEALRLMETAEHSVDAVMERWELWKQGESLYPNYLMANHAATQRGVAIRRLFIFAEKELTLKQTRLATLRVLNEQQDAGIAVFFACREQLRACPGFQRLREYYHRAGSMGELNAAMFDAEILLFSRSYGKYALGEGHAKVVSRINELQITWRPDDLQTLTPAPLFDMTPFVWRYRGEKHFLQKVLA